MQIKHVRCEIIEETSQGALRTTEMSDDLRFKVLHVEDRSLSGNVGAKGSEPPLPFLP